MDNEANGENFYVVRVTRDIHECGELGVYADSVTTGPDGSLCFSQHSADRTRRFQGVIIPPGSWKFCYIEDAIEGKLSNEEAPEA